ncbi:MAG: diguanylate cyclase [Clostridium sp.]|nr:diguanylate cyclase [Clostridium sp.]
MINFEINEEENFSEYVVKNCEDNEKYILYILKNDFTYEKTRQYLLRKFRTLRNLNFENVVNLLDIEIIYNIDGIKLDKPRYGYILEFVNVENDTQKYLQECSASEKLDIFMEFTAAVNTLNMNGYIFNDITIKDIILVTDENGKIKVKIKNLLQREISKFALVNSSNYELAYTDSIENGQEGVYPKENIAEIVKIFNKIFTNKELKNELNCLKDIKHVFNQVNTISNFYRIKYFIKCINERTKGKYKEFTKEALDRVINDIDAVGIEDEIKFVEKAYKRISENKEKYRIIQFEGDSGSGKSRLLDEIQYVIERKYFANVIYFRNYEDKFTKEQIYDLYEKYIYSHLDKSLIERYGVYIKKFLAMITHTDSISNENPQIMQLINRIGKLITEYTLKRPLIIIIDDLHKRDTIFLRFFRYLSFWGYNIENLIVVFSMNESECNEEFLGEVNEIKNLDGYEIHRISYLNQYNTTKVIQNMLKTNNKLSKLSNRIYSETLGNPQYIKAVINELYSNKELYFNYKTGLWECSIDYKKTLIPKSLEEKLERYLSELNNDEIKVLKKLSIFETPLSEEIILGDLLNGSEETEIFKRLKEKGYFIDKISDQGILVGFTNNLLRNILYIKLNHEEKYYMHCSACEFLEKEIDRSEYYMEEFLLHLRKSRKNEKLLYYIRKYAVSLEVKGDYNKSIYYYSECFKYCDKKEMVDIAIIIAKQYKKISSYENSYKYFNIAKEIIERENYDLKIRAYVLLEMVTIKINMRPINNDNIVRKLAKIRKMLDSVYYPTGEAYYYYSMGMNYRLTNNKKDMIKNIEKALKICEENNITSDIYGWILITLAMFHFKYKDLDYSKKIAEKSIDNFKNNQNLNGIILSEIMYTRLFIESDEDFDRVLDRYNGINKLCVQKKAYKKEILVLNDIANLYLMKGDYDNAEKYLLRALSIQREEGISTYSIKICNSLSMLYIKWGKIQEAVKYHYLLHQIEDGTKIFEIELIYKNSVYSEYNEMICNYKEAYEYLDNVFSHISKCKGRMNSIVICRYYELKLHLCSNESMAEDIYSKIEEISVVMNEEDSASIKIRAVKTILDIGYYNLAERLFYNINNILQDYNTQGIYAYLELSFKDKQYYNFLINKAIRISSFLLDNKVKADLLYIVGVKYSELACCSLALNYYSEAIFIHNNIIKLLPGDDRIVYANSSSFLKCRKKLIDCLNRKISSGINFLNIETINSSKELAEIMDELRMKNILKNKEIYSLSQDIYERCYYNDVSDIYSVFNSFSSSIEDNLKSLLKYMARITLADKAVIIAETNEGKNSAICSYRISGNNEVSKYLLWKLDGDEDIVVLENNDDSFDQLSDERLKENIRACLYMKLRNNDISSSTSVNARLILIAENAINYINSDTAKIIEKFRPFIIFLLEKYNLTILSMLDKLTGAYNRKYFEEAFVSLIDNSRKVRKPFGVIMFDIDDFKGVNDKYGHQTGDEVLVKLIREVKKCITKKDVIGRYGGEEFIVLLPDTDETKTLNIAEKIRADVENAKILGEKRPVTISIGIAMNNEYSLNQEQLIKRADEALYKSKNDGKNRCTLWKKNYVVSTSKISNDELAGVLSGNITKDYNLFSILKDISSLVKVRQSTEERIYKFISKMMQVIECDTATVFIVEDENIINTFSKVRAKDGFNIEEKFNFECVYKCISEQKGMYLVDWGNIDNHNIHGIPDWKSICISPVIYDGYVIAVIYLSVSVNNKEFGITDLNLLNCFADVALPIFS